MPRSEKEKMLAGALYDAFDPEPVADRRRAQRLLARYNATGPDDGDARAALLLGAGGAGAVVTSDLPPDSLAAGNPARIIRSLG
ncbi:MAG: maltose acetyltransferase domain-containing protein [Alphaproteobacteria bacterium]